MYTGTIDKYKELTDIVERAIKGEASEEEYADLSNEFKDAITLMYICIGLTSVVCMEIIKDSEITITVDEMIKFNIGAFFVMFAVSGICYLSSAIFNREENSISVGGGLTMFFLVCSILGLFGEEVIPSAIRIDAMNYFNYASIITLFNVSSMLNGTTEYVGGLAVLFVIGIVSYVVGIVKLDKKDLPL